MYRSSRALAGGLLLLVALWPLPASGADQKLVDELLIEIAKMPMVDSHSHVPLPMQDAEKLRDPAFRFDVSWLLGDATYVGEFLYGKDWAETKKMLAMNSQHAYYRPIRQALVDLYGLDPKEELSDENVADISTRMAAKRRDTESWYGEVYRRAGVRHVIWLEGHPGIDTAPDNQSLQIGNPGNALPYTTYHAMWNVDSAIVFIATSLTDKEKQQTGFQSRIDQTESHFGINLRNLADMEGFIDRAITEFFRRGGVGLKSTAAYFRPLNFDIKVPREEAETLFTQVVARKVLPQDKRTRLEDYLMTKVLQKLNQLKKPIQFHTGNQQSWNLVANSNPLGLNRLLYDGDFSNVKFVILHGGYPFTQEAITMVRYYTQCLLGFGMDGTVLAGGSEKPRCQKLSICLTADN